jgi:integrase
VRNGRVGPPKSSYGRRSIPLTPLLARELWARRKAAEHAQDSDLVWPSATGGFLDVRNLHRDVLKPAAKTAGVPWCGFHTLRHTCGTLLFRHGLNAKQVQLWLGHHSPVFTLATYVHLLPEDIPVIDVLAAVAPSDEVYDRVDAPLRRPGEGAHGHAAAAVPHSH